MFLFAQAPYMQEDVVFKFELMSYGKTYTLEEKLARMDKFGHLPKGKVRTRQFAVSRCIERNNRVWIVL